MDSGKPVECDGIAGNFDVDFVTVFAAMAGFEGARTALECGQAMGEFGGVPAGVPIGHGEFAKFLESVAQHCGKTLVGLDDFAGSFDEHVAIAGLLKKEPQMGGVLVEHAGIGSGFTRLRNDQAAVAPVFFLMAEDSDRRRERAATGIPQPQTGVDGTKLGRFQ